MTHCCLARPARRDGEPVALAPRAARRGQHPRHARLPGRSGEEGRQGRSRRATPPGSLTDAQLAALETHQAALMKADVKAVRAWSEGKPSAFDPKADLEPLLAVWAHARRHAARERLHALAGRAGRRPRASRCARSRACSRRTWRWSATATACRSCSPSTPASACPSTSASSACRARTRTSWPWAASSRGRAARRRSARPPPSGRSPARKNWNWGEKNLGIRDDKVLARELLEEPDVKALVPRIQALPAQRIAVIGHSFTMQLHWSTPGAFVPVVTAIFARENPKVEFRQFQGGGLTSTRAVNRFYADVAGVEAAAGAARGDQPDRRGPRELPAPRPRPRGGGSEGPHLRRRARPQGHRQRAARAGARGRARDRHDRDRGEPAARRRPGPRALPVPRRHPHDGALPPADGEGVAEVPGGRARGRSSPGGRRWTSRSSTPSRSWGARRRSGPRRPSARRSRGPERRA